MGAAPADHVIHGIVYLLVRGVGLAGQKVDRLQHDAGLAVAALGYLFLNPGDLDGMIFRQPFNGGYLAFSDFINRNRAGAGSGIGLWYT